MASTYSNLKIELMATGANAGTWGSTTNTNLGTALEQALAQTADIDFTSGDVTLTLTDTNAAQNARALRLNVTNLSGAQNLIVPAVQKPYIVNNSGGSFAVTIKVSGQTGVIVPAGKTMLVYNNGTDVVDAVTHLSSVTLGSALPIASGGTGSTTAAFSGENITSLNASAISSGTVGTARLASGTANSTTYLRGDQTWQPLTAPNDGTLTMATSGVGLSGSATFTADDSDNVTFTVTSNAASANGASTLVARDASGNFAANTITANLTGTAANATVLQTARNFEISGGATASAVSFDGSGAVNLNVTAMNASTINAGTVGTARLASGTANSSTFLRGDQTWAAVPSPNDGTLTMAVSGTGLSGSATFTADDSDNVTFTVTSNASSSNGASTLVARDASGNFAANTITATITGSATSISNTSSNGYGARTVSTGSPTGGSDGDIWYKY